MVLNSDYRLLVVLWGIIAKSVTAFVTNNDNNQSLYLALIKEHAKVSNGGIIKGSMGSGISYRNFLASANLNWFAHRTTDWLGCSEVPYCQAPPVFWILH